ncbi:hypothetical protein PGSY75_1140900 [Plasmodium gaboni]|uniref:Uncharacterized protein n=1 Tax=Plasmodium gaboni TaxID=647221 RepID=A0A151LJD1_9APIC|nr:hypothetical protein PGSY75_1140900 [Plasmodium gaboni]KYN99044.1 hypothetical protein PGSY75_1140900 [Plasmodium gaboni]
MIKKILNNISTLNDIKDDDFSHAENILNLIEGILVHENSYWKYVNVLNELTTLCYEDPVNFRSLLFSKKQKDLEEKEKKINQIVDRILIVLEKYEDIRSTFIYSISKLVLINDYNLNIRILHILCNLQNNQEYKYYIYSVFEEIISATILNLKENETLCNIFKGLAHLPKDKFIAGSFSNCINKVIDSLRNKLNEDALKLLSVLTLDKENCIIAYDEGLLKILTEEMKNREEENFDQVPNYMKDIYLIVSHLCNNYIKHCDILINDKMHSQFYFKKIKSIININIQEISPKQSLFANIIISTLNSMCKYNEKCLFELCNSYHYIDLFLICIKMENGNPYLLSASLDGLLIFLSNEDIYKNNINYILNNSNNLKIILPLLFGHKYYNMLNTYNMQNNNEQNVIQPYLYKVVENTLDIVTFFFQKEIDKYTIKVKKQFRNSDVNNYLITCLEMKNTQIIIKLLKCIYFIPFTDYSLIELHKIFFILHDKSIDINDEWKEIYYYSVMIYIKVLKNEDIKKVIECYNIEQTIISLLRIMNEFLLKDILLQKKTNDVIVNKKNMFEINDEYSILYNKSDYYLDLNKIIVKLLCICSHYKELRVFLRNNLISNYFIQILTNEDKLYNELKMDYDILIERTWCCNMDNIFKTLMKNNMKKNKKVTLRLLINIADICSGYFYQFKSTCDTNIFHLCDLEEKHWEKKKILQYFYFLNEQDKQDYIYQVNMFLKHYMIDLFTILYTFVENDIFIELKKELQENYFPGVLKYHKLKYEKKIKKWKIKEKQIKQKIKNINKTYKDISYDNYQHGNKEKINDVYDNSFNLIDRDVSSIFNSLNEDLRIIKEKKKKLIQKLYNNNFKQTFDISVENEIGTNIEYIFDIPNVVKKKKSLKYLKSSKQYQGEDMEANNIILRQKEKNDESAEILMHTGEDMSGYNNTSAKKNKTSITSTNNNNNHIYNNSNKYKNCVNNISDYIHTNENNRDTIYNNNKKNHSSDNNSSNIENYSTSSCSTEDSVYMPIIDKFSCELLKYNKENIYEHKLNNNHILLFNKRGIFINSNKGEINESFVLYAILRIFYSIIINNINNEYYLKVKEFLLRNNVIKTLLNVLNQCSFYDCNVYAHFFRLYSEILKMNITAVESMNMLLFYNIFFYYSKLLSRVFINKIRNNEYILSYKEQYLFAELSKLFYYFTQKIIYIQFSQYKEIQKWCVDCTLFHFFYKNNIILLLYLFIYIHSVHHGSIYASYIYHKKNFFFIHTIFFYTLFTLSYLMCFSKKLKYFILYFINYKKYIHKVLFRKSIIHSLFFYNKLIYLRIVLQNQLSLESKTPTQIYHLSPVIYIRQNSVEWYFIALGVDKYYLVYIPDNFEENITEDKDIKLIIYSERKYVDLTRICISKINDNLVIFGYINYNNYISYESYDIFISLNKYFQNNIVSYAQFLSGNTYENRVDLIQDNIIMNNLKSYMNTKNILISSFAYKEVSPSDYMKYKDMREKKKKKREQIKNNIEKRQDYDEDTFYSNNISDNFNSNDSLLSYSSYTEKYNQSDDNIQRNCNIQSNDEDFNIFRRNKKSKNKRKLLFFVLTKKHFYVFKFNFKHWIFLSPFIEEEKNDIHLYVESSIDSHDEYMNSKNQVIKNDKIYLNNILGITSNNNIGNAENISFARKCAIRNTIKYNYSCNNTEFTNEQILSTNMSTNSIESQQRESQVISKSEVYDERERYSNANKFFLKHIHKYDNEYLSQIKFVNNNESIIEIQFKIKNNEDCTEKNIKMVLFDDYTRELWKRSLAHSLNIQLVSSEWRRKWN